ncbi:MAG TPA: FAD-dependent oxidoreductase [Pseudonocardiaceae bacterium]|jgi:2-polyprenyl-6-methoxyphenol hydroxylase-like FAD-dependent oxidoreductase|nr:FAD-dependent oxidoreductase [Pseudonocardiaceae bacterium]
MPDQNGRPDVLIVGAGPVGLSAALQLGRAGASVQLLERRTGPSDQPRAHVVNARTMELFRSWGIADAIRGDGLAPELAASFGWVTEIRGEEFATIDYIDAETFERYSPETLCSCPQDLVESRLRAAALNSGQVRIEQGREVVGFRTIEETTGTVGEVDVRDTDGATRTLRARFVIAADGASSPMRRLAGVAMERSVPLDRRLNVYFYADLTPYTRRRPHILWFVHNVATQGVLIPFDGARRWVYSVDLADGETVGDYDEQRCLDLVRAAAGDRGLTIDLRARMSWTLDMGVAARFRAGPLFLVGDAAHRFPPTGGFGMNSGIQDSHNLAWKLDLVLRGLAEESLLDTYEGERRPVAVFNAAQSTLNAEQQMGADASLNTPETLALLASPEGAALRAGIAANLSRIRDQFHNLGQQFGHVYRGAGLVDDGSPPRDSTISEYRTTARPGARAPHARLRTADGARSDVSTIELVTGGWTVLVAGDPRDWRAGARHAAQQHGVRLDVHGIGSTPAGADHADYVDAETPGNWRELYEVAEGGAVLIRPDGHVLARWHEQPPNPAAALSGALTATLTPDRGKPAAEIAAFRQIARPHRIGK